MSQEVSRRDYLKTIGALIGGLAIGGAVGWLAKPEGAAKTVTQTITTGGQTLTQTITQTLTAGGFPSTEKYKIILVGGDLGGEFWVPIHRGAEDASKWFNVDFILTGPSSTDAVASHDAMEAAIAEKPDAIVAVLFDETMNQLTNEALSKGIPVVSMLIDDNPPHPSNRLAYIGTSQYDSCFNTAKVLLNKYLSKKYPNGGKGVIFMHRPGAPDLTARAQGFQDALTPAGFTFEVTTAGPEAETANEMAEAYLRSHPDVVVALGCDGISTPAAGRAIDVLGLKDKVLGAGTDVIPRNVELMQKGCLWALMNQQQYIQPIVTALSIWLHLYSDKELAPFSASTGSGVVTPDNLALYTRTSRFH